MRTRFLRLAIPALLISAAAVMLPAQSAEPADLVLTGGRIVTLDAANTIAQAIAVRGGRIVAVGSDAQMRRLVGPATKLIPLEGRMVLPGLIETHCHPIGVARAELQQTYVELRSIAELQAWIRQEAAKTEAGQWIRVPRTEITRMAERRFPTVAELDAAAPRHPVAFKAVTHWVLNSAALKLAQITDQTQEIAGGRIVRDEQGHVALIADGDSFVNKLFPAAQRIEESQLLDSLQRVLDRYAEQGYTAVFDRAAGDRSAFDLYRKLAAEGRLPVRVSVTFRSQFKNGAAVEQFVKKLGIAPSDGDEWVRPGPLKITVDGGIHWGTTRLSEPYGPRRSRFYFRPDPTWQGDLRFSQEQMADIFAAAHRLGWQMSAHVTGDDGTLTVLKALEQSDAIEPAAGRRFNLIHSYFPGPEILALGSRLGVGVDTQGYLYYRDGDFIADIYGPQWAERFIALQSWLDAGIPVATNSDHMIGLDPDHAMNSFNPFLMLEIAVTRRTDSGAVHGESQKMDRIEALRCVTSHAAWLSFDENRQGTVEIGKLADFVVIDGDYLACPPEQIRKLRATLTVAGGRVTHARP